MSSFRLICTTAILLGSSCMLIPSVDLALANACGSQSTACGIETGTALDWCWVYLSEQNICSGNLYIFYNENKFTSNKIKYQNTKHYTFYWWMCKWIVRGGGSSNRNAIRDESVETGDESVETTDEAIKAREKYNNHVIMWNNALVFKD